MTAITATAYASAPRFGAFAGKLACSVAILALGDEPVRWLKAYATVAPAQLNAIYAQCRNGLGGGNG